jgi:hypothetical protein
LIKHLEKNKPEGVLLEILKRINNENEFCVEFGAGNGMLGSNSALFRLQYNWDYLLFEIDDDLIQSYSGNESKESLKLYSKLLAEGSKEKYNKTMKTKHIYIPNSQCPYSFYIYIYIYILIYI